MPVRSVKRGRRWRSSWTPDNWVTMFDRGERKSKPSSRSGSGSDVAQQGKPHGWRDAGKGNTENGYGCSHKHLTVTSALSFSLDAANHLRMSYPFSVMPGRYSFSTSLFPCWWSEESFPAECSPVCTQPIRGSAPDKIAAHFTHTQNSTLDKCWTLRKIETTVGKFCMRENTPTPFVPLRGWPLCKKLTAGLIISKVDDNA